MLCKCVKPSMEVEVRTRYRKGFPYPPTNRSWVRLHYFTEPDAVMKTHLCYEIGTRPEEDNEE